MILDTREEREARDLSTFHHHVCIACWSAHNDYQRRTLHRLTALCIRWMCIDNMAMWYLQGMGPVGVLVTRKDNKNANSW